MQDQNNERNGKYMNHNIDMYEANTRIGLYGMKDQQVLVAKN